LHSPDGDQAVSRKVVAIAALQELYLEARSCWGELDDVAFVASQKVPVWYAV